MGPCGWLPVPADFLLRAGVVALMLTVSISAAGCGGSGGGSGDPIKIAFLTDCTTSFATSRPGWLAGAELPFLARGAKLRGSQPSNGVTRVTVGETPVQLLLGCESYTNFATL